MTATRGLRKITTRDEWEAKRAEAAHQLIDEATMCIEDAIATSTSSVVHVDWSPYVLRACQSVIERYEAAGWTCELLRDPRGDTTLTLS